MNSVMVDQSPTIIKTWLKDRDQTTIERTTEDTSNLEFLLLLPPENAEVFGTALADSVSHLTLPLVDGNNCLQEL
jgi:hypothetical protein